MQHDYIHFTFILREPPSQTFTHMLSDSIQLHAHNFSYMRYIQLHSQTAGGGPAWRPREQWTPTYSRRADGVLVGDTRKACILRVDALPVHPETLQGAPRTEWARQLSSPVRAPLSIAPLVATEVTSRTSGGCPPPPTPPHAGDGRRPSHHPHPIAPGCPQRGLSPPLQPSPSSGVPILTPLPHSSLTAPLALGSGSQEDRQARPRCADAAPELDGGDPLQRRTLKQVAQVGHVSKGESGCPPVVGLQCRLGVRRRSGHPRRWCGAGGEG